MSIAEKLTNYGVLNKVDAYRACEAEGVKSKKKEGVLSLVVFTFEDGSFVQFSDTMYWHFNK